MSLQIYPDHLEIDLYQSIKPVENNETQGTIPKMKRKPMKIGYLPLDNSVVKVFNLFD